MSAISAEQKALIHRIVSRNYCSDPIDVEPMASQGSFVVRFRMDPGGGFRFLKIATTLDREVRREPTVIERLLKAGISVPQVEFSGEDAESRKPYFITFALTGEPLILACKASKDWAPAACVQAGSFAAQLGKLPPDFLSDGNIGHDGAEILKSLPALKTKLTEQGLWSKAFDRVFDRIANSATSVSGLVHGDFNAGQVICDGSGALGVLDWERAGAGNIFHDVGEFAAGMLKFGASRVHADAFLEGFRSGWQPDSTTWLQVKAWEAYSLIGAAGYHLSEGRRVAGRHWTWAQESFGD